MEGELKTMNDDFQNYDWDDYYDKEQAREDYKKLKKIGAEVEREEYQKNITAYQQKATQEEFIAFAKELGTTPSALAMEMNTPISGPEEAQELDKAFRTSLRNSWKQQLDVRRSRPRDSQGRFMSPGKPQGQKTKPTAREKKAQETLARIREKQVIDSNDELELANLVGDFIRENTD
jgi:hypothetical protein